MSYTYANIPDSTGATVVATVDANVLPAMALWAVFNINPDYLTDVPGKGLAQADLQHLATATGLSIDCVTFFYHQAKNTLACTQSAAAFQNIMATAAYSGPDCPGVSTAVSLAHLAKLTHPAKA